MVRTSRLAGVALAVALVPAAAAAQELPPPVELRFERVADGLERPVYLTHAGDGSGELYVVERDGRVRIIHEDGSVEAEPFLDITDRVTAEGFEQGLMSIAFHPRYPDDDRLVAYYTRAGDDAVVISSFRVVDGAADASSERLILEVPQLDDVHNGGTVLFDETGRLVVGLGDGGWFGRTGRDPAGLDTLRGNIVRLDIDAGDPFSIPDDNGWFGRPGVRPEIHAAGVRNPYRMSIDRVDGSIYFGDVGQSQWEEINVLPQGIGGQHFGWDVVEGPECSTRRRTCDPGFGDPPALIYPHTEGLAVVGGVVYRGEDEPDLQGIYLFADWRRGTIWGARASDVVAGTAERFELGRFDHAGGLVAFGEDERGEVYLVDMDGRIVRLRTRPAE